MSSPETTSNISVFSLQYWREMSNDRIPKIILISLLLCVVCSFFVSWAAISLKPLQERNRLDSKRKNIVQVAGLSDHGGTLDEIFAQYIEPRLVDLEAGTFVRDLAPENFEQRVSTEDPALSRQLTGQEDMAKIRVRENFAISYLIKDDAGQVNTIILPIRGYGLWSTLYGFVAVDTTDGNAIKALQFYEHAETPGLGAEIDNPSWRALWSGKKIFDDQGDIAIAVDKGDHSNNPHKVDSLSGATLTSRGVNNLVQFWLGPLGFEALLRQLPENL